MLELIINPNNVVFSACIGIAISLFMLEIATGGLLEGIFPDIDLDFDADIDIDIPEVEAPPVGVVSSLLGWVGAKNVPFSIFLVSFLMSFGLCGLLIQATIHQFIGFYLWGLLAVVPAFVVGFTFTKGFTYVLSFVVPKEHNQATSMKNMIGTIATVYTPVRFDSEGLVNFADRYGVKHRARARSLNEKEFMKDVDVLLTSYDESTRVFKVAEVPLTLRKEI